MADQPILTSHTAVGDYGTITVASKPVTVYQEGLAPGEFIEIVRRNQADNGWVPFRSGGTVRLSYNNSAFPIVAQGDYGLRIVSELSQPVNAGWRMDT